MAREFWVRRVQVERIEPRTHGLLPYLYYRDEGRPGQFTDEVYSEPLQKRAEKALQGAQPGHVVEIEIDYNGYNGIVDARRVTDTPEDNIRVLTEQVAELEKVLFEIPHIMRQASDAVRGDRYEESRRVIHSVALAIENSFPKREV